MSSGGPNLTDVERSQLRQFVRLVYDMSRSRFIQRVTAQDHTIASELQENGEYKVTVPDYDWEDFRSFLTAFRQVAMSAKELVYLPRIRNIVGKHASDQLRIELAKLKAHVVPLLEGRLVGIRFGTATAEVEIALTSFQLLDALVNGAIFHVDPDREQESNLLLSHDPGTYLWIVLTEIIVPVLNASVWLANVIRFEKFLPESDFPDAKGYA